MKKAVLQIEWIINILLFGASLYQAIAYARVFYLAAFSFLVEVIIYALASFDNGLKGSAIVQFLHSPAAVVMMTLSVAFGIMVKPSIILVIAVIAYMTVKICAIIYHGMEFKKTKSYTCYARMNNGITSAFSGLILISGFTCSALSYHVDGMAMLITFLLIAVLSALISPYFIISYLITAFTRKALPVKGKIKAIADFFNKYRIGFFFGLGFSTITSITCFINSKDAEVYLWLGFFYVLIIVARLATYVWNRILENKVSDPMDLSRKRNGILMFNSLLFLGSNFILTAGLINLSSLRLDSTIPVWVFATVMFPFSILNMIINYVSRRTSRQADNAYLESTIDQGLITSLFSFVAGVSFFLKYISNIPVAIITWLIMISVVIAFVSVMLVFSFVRSILGVTGNRQSQLDKIKEKPVNDQPLS